MVTIAPDPTASTVNTRVPCTPWIAAVMLVDPAVRAVTRPWLFTLATSAALEAQVTAPALLIVFPDAFTAIAENCDV
jgi:hypothetical protein